MTGRELLAAVPPAPDVRQLALELEEPEAAAPRAHVAGALELLELEADELRARRRRRRARET